MKQVSAKVNLKLSLYMDNAGVSGTFTPWPPVFG